MAKGLFETGLCKLVKIIIHIVLQGVYIHTYTEKNFLHIEHAWIKHYPSVVTVVLLLRSWAIWNSC